MTIPRIARSLCLSALKGAPTAIRMPHSSIATTTATQSAHQVISRSFCARSSIDRSVALQRSHSLQKDSFTSLIAQRHFFSLIRPTMFSFPCREVIAQKLKEDDSAEQLYSYVGKELGDTIFDKIACSFSECEIKGFKEIDSRIEKILEEFIETGDLNRMGEKVLWIFQNLCCGICRCSH